MNAINRLAGITTTALPLTRSLLRLAQERRLPTYLKEMQGIHTLSYMNIFMCLRGAYPRKQVTSLARRCVWHRIYNDLDYEAFEWNRFHVTGLSLLQDALEKGRGAIVCTQHAGPYRRIFYELVRDGFTVNLIADAMVSRSFVEQAKSQLARQNIDAEELDEKFHLINAEHPASACHILNALKRNEVVLIYLDGNTGVGGQKETHRHSVTVDFFGWPIGVRKGACHLAYVAQAPIIPLFAHWDSGHRPVMKFFDPIISDGSQDVQSFCQSGMQKLYKLSEQHISAHPEQYEEWFHFHRWLQSGESLRPPSAQSLKEIFDEFKDEVAHGKTRFRVDDSKVAVVLVGDSHMLVDRRRGKILKVRPITEPVVRLLSAETTLAVLSRKLAKKYSVQQVLEEVVRLDMLHLLERNPIAMRTPEIKTMDGYGI